MRIHFFTPLPPLQTDIANHSASVLAELARKCEVLAWTTQPDWDCPGLSPSQVRQYDPAELPLRELNAADATFYNFGNNFAFHHPILQASMAVPGVAVLHDLSMQHFFARVGLSRSGVAGYLAAMGRHHGAAAVADARRFLDNEIGIEELAERYPLPLAAAERAIAILGHNREGLQALSQQTRLRTYYLPLSTRFLDAAAPARTPAAPPYRLIVFGFIGRNRRVASILQALAATQARDLYLLDIYGPLDEAASIDELIGKLDLRDRVFVHGFVPAEQLTEALNDAHLALNLRDPTMGEASGSQLRIWAHALPSLVTRVGWYASLPAEAVGFVEPDDEVGSIQRHLAAFHADQRPYIEAGRRGRDHAEAAHSPGAYADALLAVAAGAGVDHRRRGAIEVAAATSRRMLELMGPEDLRYAAPGLARSVADLFGPPL